MNEIATWDFQGNEVRTVEVNGDPWWVAKDVCDVLGLNNVGEAVASLDDDERSKISNSDLGRPGGHASPIINEPGLYSLILRSRKPEAKAFKRWVTHEVLPQIRKTGAYVKPQSNLDVLESMVAALREQERKNQEIDNRLAIVEANQHNESKEYMTVVAFATLRGVDLPHNKANMLGRKAAKLSREYGYSIGKVHSEVWGEVNSYHIDVLATAFGDKE